MDNEMLRGLPITLLVVGIVTILTTALPLQTQVQASTSEGAIGSTPESTVVPSSPDDGGTECPEGFIPATPPLNPQLGCLPESATSDPGEQRGPGIPPGGCPEGFILATPPLNPQLGCLPESITTEQGEQPGPGIPPGGCPEGTSPATPPLNPQLGCLPNTITSDQGVQPGPGIPPGGCPEGFILATPPLNPQLGCLPGSITAEPGEEFGENATGVQDESADDETTGGKDEVPGSTLRTVPEDQQPSGGEDQEGGEDSEENGNDRGSNGRLVQ